MTAKIAMRKLRKEKTWSVAIFGILAIGLTTWMVIPSISESLKNGLSAYGNNVATYMFVYNTGFSDYYSSRIPANITEEIAAMPSVQDVYPIVSNSTFLFNAVPLSFLPSFPNGTRPSNATSLGIFQSAVIGGPGGFPTELISVSEGRLPRNEPGFIINGVTRNFLSLNQTYVTGFMVDTRNGSLDANGYYVLEDQTFLRFNATNLGAMPNNPMLQQVEILWNSTFLRQKLGTQAYDITFGGDGANLFIVKVQDIEHVDQVARLLQSLFKDYSGYSVVYDQATAEAELSFQSGTGVLYELIGAFSMIFVISLVFLLTYVFSGRRRWEAGLLITQGWDWRKVTKLFIYYYLILGLVAGIASIVISLFIGTQIGYTFRVYANTIVIPVLVSPYLVISSFFVSILVSAVAAYFAVWRMKKMGLDSLLREF